MLATWSAALWTTLTTLWFWIILPAVALLVGITVEILTRNQTSRRAAIYRALVTMLVAPAVFYGIQRVVEAPQRAAEEQADQKRTELLNDIAAHVGNPDAAKELIELRARALFGPSTGDAERFANDLVAQLPEKQVRYKALQDDSAKEAMRRRLDWEPFLRAFLEQFDQRVDALQTRGLDIAITIPGESMGFRGEVPLVQPGPQQRNTARYARTPGGYELRVYVWSGQVDFGKLTHFPSFYLAGAGGGDANREFIIVQFGPDHVMWEFGMAPTERKSGRQVIGKDSQAEEYRQAVRDSLNRAFEYALLVTTK